MASAPTAARLLVPASTDLFARRFSAGLDATLKRQMRQAGGARAWFERQLSPPAVRDQPGLVVDGWFDLAGRSPGDIFDRQVGGQESAGEVMLKLARWTLARRLQSHRQVQESLVDFWSNLLHVPLNADNSMFWRVDYDATIRRLAFTSYEELLTAAVTHPAMGLYLDNAVSTKNAPNENLGRELLELHSVGVGNYSEADVVASSRLLTGYRVDVWKPSFRAFYDPTVHDTDPVRVLGFSHANADPDGRAATTAYLRYLARHPDTAARVARRLCLRYVSDRPTASIVTAVTRAYLAGGTAIKPTLRAMVDHPDFARSAGQKIRTPTEDLLATCRALRVRPGPPREKQSFTNAVYWVHREAGNAPYEWPAPDGYPEVGEAWLTAGRLLNSSFTHLNLANGSSPRLDVAYRDKRAWLPRLPATVDQVIITMSSQLLFAVPPARIRRAVAEDLGLTLNQRIDGSRLNAFRIASMLASLLDSPMHLRR